MVSELAKKYEEFEENGGEIAIRGFNFQAYSGIYYIFHLHKNNKEFEIIFEGDDDITINNLSNKKKFKIQVKSSSLTRGGIIKGDKGKCTLGKLLFKNGYDYYMLSFPTNTSKALKDVSKMKEPLLGGTCYQYDCTYKGTSKENSDCQEINELINDDAFKNKQLLFQEMPFTRDSDNCFKYLLGDASSKEDNEKFLNINQEQLLALLGTIYNKSSKKFFKKKLNNDIMKKMEGDSKLEKIINEHLNLLKNHKKNPSYISNLITEKPNYDKDKIYYNNVLEHISFPLYDDETNFIEYFNECLLLMDQKIKPENKKIINKYIRAWIIIDKVTQGGE